MKKLNSKGFSHVELVLIVLVVVAIGGLGWYSFSQMKQRRQQASISSEEVIPLETPAELLTVSKVKELATAQVSDSDVQGIELEQEDEGLVYKVIFVNGKVLVFNATTGLQLASEKADEASGKLPVGTEMKLEFSEALKIARAAMPGVDVRKVELEQEDGVAVYSVRFVNGARIDVNAQDGSIVRTKTKKSKEEKKSLDKSKKSSSSSRGSRSSSSDREDDDKDEQEDQDDDNDSDSNDDNDQDDDNDNSGSGSSNSGSSDDDD